MCLGIPGKIISITDAQLQTGVVDIGGIQRVVNLACIAEEGDALAHPSDLAHHVGSWVLVHVGFAMSVIDEAEALATLALLTELGELAELEAGLQPEPAAMQEATSGGTGK